MLPVKADLAISLTLLSVCLDSARVYLAFMLSYKMDFSSA